MKKLIGSFILWSMGWKLRNDYPVEKVNRCVLVCAPHTSNWDFVFAIASFWKMGIPMRFFIKDAWTKPWYGIFIKWMGAIGVDRSHRQNMTDYAAGLLSDKTKKMYILNTPEGTRSFAEKWKKGFYYIATKAEVPILFAFADYGTKTAGIIGGINPENHSLEDILNQAQETYREVVPKDPSLFNPNIQ